MMFKIACQKALCSPCLLRSTATRHLTGASLAQNQREILEEASALTRSLYRLCMRSVKLIRQGNEADAAEFAAREEKQMEDMIRAAEPAKNPDDERLAGVISMLPPVEPEAELKARSEYYAQYTNENFFAESDCLRPLEGDVPSEGQFTRYFYHLRKGEDHRKWLLEDMKFQDPFQFDLKRVDRLEERVKNFLENRQQFQLQQMTPEEVRELEQARKDMDEYDTDEEAFSDEEDDEDDVRIHYKNQNRRYMDDDL